MNLNQIRKLALIVSVVGLVAIYFATGSIEPKRVKISEIKDGDYVSIIGYVDEKSKMSKGWLLTIEDETGKIKTVAWSDSHFQIPQRGDKAIFTGFVKNYKGSLELELENITGM